MVHLSKDFSLACREDETVAETVSKPAGCQYHISCHQHNCISGMYIYIRKAVLFRRIEHGRCGVLSGIWKVVLGHVSS